MAQQLFEVSAGISIDGNVSILYGTTVPSSNTAAMAAPIGSSYTNTTTGKQYTRVKSTGAATDWTAEALEEAAIVVSNVGSTFVLLDKILVGDSDAFAWEVTATEQGTPANKTSLVIHATHNATSTAIATTVKHSISNKIAQGSKILGLQLEARITSGATTLPTQYLEIWGSALVTTKFTLVRMVKNLAGNSSVAASGATTTTTTPARNLGYDIAGWSAGVVNAGEVLLKVVVPRAVTIPANMAGSFAACVYAPATTTTFELSKNGVVFSTLEFLTGDVHGTFSSCPEQTWLAGDVFSLTAVNSDVNMSGVATSIVGNIIDTQALDIFSWSAANPIAGQLLHLSMIPRTFYFPASFNGSIARCVTAPGSTVVYDIQQNGTTVGKVTFSAGSTVGIFSTYPAVVFVAGQVLSIVPENSDSVMTDVMITLAGSVPA